MGPPNDLPTAKARIAELERLVGQQQLHLDFFSRSLAVMGRGEPKRRRAHLFGVIEKMTREGPQGETTAAARASVELLVRLAGLSRASYHRWPEPKLTAA